MTRLPSSLQALQAIFFTCDQGTFSAHQRCIFFDGGAGPLVHHVMVGVRSKGLPAHTAVLPEQAPGSARCELEVLAAARVTLNPAARALGWPEAAWEALLVLRTGRTHQVGRAPSHFQCWPWAGLPGAIQM